MFAMYVLIIMYYNNYDYIFATCIALFPDKGKIGIIVTVIVVILSAATGILLTCILIIVVIKLKGKFIPVKKLT